MVSMQERPFTQNIIPAFVLVILTPTGPKYTLLEPILLARF